MPTLHEQNEPGARRATLTVQHNGEEYRLAYAGSPKNAKDFRYWAASTRAPRFMRAVHSELVTGLERRKQYTKKPPHSAGYGVINWVRFIYGYEIGTTIAPLIGKLYVALYPEHAHLFKFKS